MNARSYLEKIKFTLASSAAVRDVVIVQEYALQDRGFFRARLTLVNDDFLEVSEYFVIVGGRANTVEYRHQWMDPAQKALRKRWENAPHHPELPSHPHHIHVDDDSHIELGRRTTILDVVKYIASQVVKNQ